MVGAVDTCTYCQSAHTVAGQAAGWSLEHTIALRDGKQINSEDELGALLIDLQRHEVADPHRGRYR
ncbi:hypothetical protein [Actinophytocola glycyrrhizae]|uniref:Carboxymuconolactone decarboxylase-like domain-containing protein n=1 Tax=Actinophytocola glycyrrhizae TaxID=2044873 RepID=A0ABV9SC02_9PSEU